MLYKKQIDKDIIWAVWRVEESIEELESILGFIIEESNSKRLKEKLATRVLLKELLGGNEPILYKESGKPYLENGYFISISHTQNYVAVSLSKTRETGIDIEIFSEKALRIKSRFVSEKEHIDSENELIHLLIHWSAKETAFKLVDKEFISLKDDFILSPFSPEKEGVFEITETRNKETYKGCYFVEDDFVLTLI